MIKEVPMRQSELFMKLSDVKEEFQKRFAIEKIVLFGSYLRDEAAEDSDVDIAILKIEKQLEFLRDANE